MLDSSTVRKYISFFLSHSVLFSYSPFIIQQQVFCCCFVLVSESKNRSLYPVFVWWFSWQATKSQHLTLSAKALLNWLLGFLLTSSTLFLPTCSGHPEYHPPHLVFQSTTCLLFFLKCSTLNLYLVGPFLPGLL